MADQTVCFKCERRFAAPSSLCPLCGGALHEVSAADYDPVGMLSADGRWVWDGRAWFAADDDRLHCPNCGSFDFSPEPGAADPDYVACTGCGYRIDVKPQPFRG